LLEPIARGEIPRWLKLAYTAWFLVWVPIYWIENGPANFLWLCDVANFVILGAIWLESPLLFSSQAVSVLLIQIVWMVDVATRLVAGFHPIGGTEYMFEAARPLFGRLLSLFHVFVPLLLVYALWRLGHDRRGWRLQTLICWLVLPASFWIGEPRENLNWLWSPFGIEQTWLPPSAFLAVCMIAYPVVLYLPTNALLTGWLRRAGRPIHGGGTL
jgi:hypothetical protein